MDSDTTRACYWPTVSKRLTQLWPGYFSTQPMRCFWPEGQKLKNLTYLGEIFQTQTQTIDGTRATNYWPDLDPSLLVSGQVKFLLLGLGRVSHLWFGYGFGKFPLKMSNFSIFCPSGQKKKCQRVRSKSMRVRAGLASFLLRVKSMFRSGQCPSLITSSSPLSSFISFCLFHSEFRFLTGNLLSKGKPNIWPTLDFFNLLMHHVSVGEKDLKAWPVFFSSNFVYPAFLGWCDELLPLN